MGNMIGSGVFLLPASLAPFGWNAVLGWIVTIAGTMVLAWVLIALTRARPLAGGPQGYVRDAFGDVAAFAITWAYWVSIWSAVASIAVAGISYLSLFVPVLGATPLLPALAAIALVWSLTLVNLAGTRAAGDVQIITLALKLVPLLAVIAVAAVALFSGAARLAGPAAGEITFGAVNSAGALALFALLGFESASIAQERMHDPVRTVARATLWGTALTGLLYLIVCSAIALMLPRAVAAASPAPFAEFFARYWSPGLGAAVAVFAIISCAGAVNGWVLMQGELPRRMAGDQLLPRWFARTDARGTPRRALLVSSAVATLVLLATASRSMQGVYEFVLLLSTSTSLWLYLACALAAWRLRVARGFAAAGAAYALWALWGAGVEASAWGLALTLAGLPLYWLARRGSAGERVEPA